MHKIQRVLLLVAAVLWTTLAFSAPKSASPQSLPLGMNYAHWRIVNCNMDDAGIVATYDQPGVRALVQSQLAAQHTSGFTTLRTLVWNMHDATGQRWGVISSANGLVEPYRTNLAQFAADIRAAGYTRWTVGFSPQWTNSAIDAIYDPSLAGENWEFIRQVRDVVVPFGPADTRIDLWNEGSPSMYWPQYSQMVTNDQFLWESWVNTFGYQGATISSIVDTGATTGVADRLVNLIAALDATGEPLPTWWEIHSYSNVKANLTAADTALSGRAADISIGESYYHDTSGKKAAQQWRGMHNLIEFTQWPLTKTNTCPTPPFTP